MGRDTHLHQAQPFPYPFLSPTLHMGASPVAQWVKNLSAMQETQDMWVQFLGREGALKEKMAPPPVFLPGKSMDRGAWWATVHGVEKSQTWLRPHTHKLNVDLQ